MKKILLLLFGVIMAVQVFPQKPEEDQMKQEWEKMHQSKEQPLKEFNNNKFGMFIHWGLYSLPAGIWNGKKIDGIGEWIMFRAQISRDEYEKMCSSFNPVKFNADEWVKYAKMAGMKYIVVMPKHHDGFSMYDSNVTDYDIVDATPFGRDPMAELYKACQKYGIKFSIYYSHSTDWKDGGDAGYADYYKLHPLEKPKFGQRVGPSNTWDPAPVSFTEYLNNKSMPQVKELLKKFPGMQEIWFDVPGYMTKQESFDFYKLVYDIQPNCLVDSRIGNDFGDYWIPGDNYIPKGNVSENTYWETPGTMNNTWGYKSYDLDWKSTKELIFWITEIASKGGNYLLNVGPTAEGVFPEESIERLKKVGQWMSVNGESVYGTTKWIVSHEGPVNMSMGGTSARKKYGFKDNFTPEDFWFTSKDNNVYVTCLKWAGTNEILVKSIAKVKNKVQSVEMLGNKKKTSWKVGVDGLNVTLPSGKPCSNGYVLKIVLKE